MTKKERYEAIEKACDEFRRSRMMIWRTSKENRGEVEFILPMTYIDGDGVAVFIAPHHEDSGYVYVSDGGRTSFHQILTKGEINELSSRYHLFRGNIYDERPPFECEMYGVAKLEEMGRVIWRIIMAIQDSYLYVARHNMKG